MAKNSKKPSAAVATANKSRKRRNKMSAAEVLAGPRPADDTPQPDGLQELIGDGSGQALPAFGTGQERAAGEPGSPQLELDGPVVMIPLDCLRESPLNPRKDIAQAEIEGLAASILAAGGVLQNLVVRPDLSARPFNRFDIVSGARRFRALNKLAAAGQIAADYPVPCKVRNVSDAELRKLALIENMQRQDMHPLDEGEVFAEMVAAGASTEQIAADIGLTPRFVQLRMQMVKNLTADAKKSFRAGDISINQARVLAMRGDSVQKSALKEIKDDGGDVSDAQLLDIMTRDLPLKSAAIFDLAKYAGGFVEDPDDADGPWFKDAKEFWRLQRAAVAERAAELKASGDYKFVQTYHPKMYFNDYAWSKRPGHKAAGAILEIKHDGEVVEHLNVVDRETLQRDEQQTARVRDAKARREAGPVEPYTKRNAIAVREAKSRALQKAIAADPQHAIDLAALAILSSRVTAGLQAGALPHQVIHPDVLAKLQDYRGKLPGMAPIDKARPNAGQGVLQLNSYSGDGKTADLVLAFTSLPKAQRTELFTLLVASRFCVGGLYETGHGEDPAELLVARHVGAEVDGDEAFTPEYLETLRKPYLLAIAARLKVRDVDGKSLEACSGKQLRAAIRTRFEQLEAGATVPWLAEFDFATRKQIDQAIVAELREQAKAAA